ncbi:endolysin [Microbacterium phage Juanyo]|nr:endolysin [Microbacterium phage Juanyo]
MATLKNHKGFWLRDDAAAAFDAYEAKYGKRIVNSAGRTVGEQQELINRWDAGGKYNRPPYLYAPARPATASNHVRNGGVAIDIGDWRTFKEHAHEFGFKWYGDKDVVHFDFVGWNGGVSQDTKNRQAWLNQSRGEKLVVDGIQGKATTAAIKRYQTFLGVTADGIWGDRTQAAHQVYYDNWHKGTAPKRPVIRKGSKGQAVKDLQARLNRDYPLYSKLAVDGIFGNGTEKVVREFQRRAGLVVDGIVGERTWGKLGF